MIRTLVGLGLLAYVLVRLWVRKEATLWPVEELDSEGARAHGVMGEALGWVGIELYLRGRVGAVTKREAILA